MENSENYKELSGLRLVNKRFDSIASTVILDKLLGAQVEIRVIGLKPVVLLDGFQKQIGIMKHCARIKELKFDLCNADGEADNEIVETFLRSVFECARHNLTSFWLACGSNKIANAIGVFDQSRNNIIRLVLSDYLDEEMQQFETTFQNINSFEIYGTKFTSIPRFSKLVKFTACQFFNNDIAAEALKDSIEAYIKDNPNLKMLKLVAGLRTIDIDQNAVCIVKYLTDLIDVSQLQDVHFSDVEIENYTKYVIIDDLSTVKATNFSYINRFTHFTHMEVSIYNENEFTPLTNFISTGINDICNLQINVQSHTIFIAWAGYITTNETKLKTFSMRFGADTTLEYENSQLDIMVLKRSRYHFKIFEKLVEIVDFANIRKFKIREKSEVKQSRTWQTNHQSEKYVIFKNGAMKANGKDGIGIKLNETLTDATIDYPSVGAEQISKFITKNIDTNLKTILVLNANTDFSIDNENWAKQSSDRVEGGVSIRFVKNETIEMERKVE